MGERVSQLVGMQAGDARPRAASVQHLHDAVTRERAAVTEPQLGARGVRMRAPHTEVAIQCAGAPLAERAGALSVTLAQDDGHVLVEVDVLGGQTRALTAAHAGVEQQPDDGLVAPILEPAGSL